MASRATIGTSTLGAGTVVTATGATKVVRVSMTSSQTGQLNTTSRYEYTVEVTLANGRKLNPWRGTIAVLEDYE